MIASREVPESAAAVRAAASRARMAAPLRAAAKRLLREPFVHFMLIGLVLFAGIQYRDVRDERYTIRVGDAERRHLEAKYRQQYGDRPSAGQLEALIAAHVREEIFVREALALHLDQDDEIVRRRLAQKYEFLQTDLGTSQPPDEQTLTRWYATNRQRYLTPPRVAFSQIYVAGDAAEPQAGRRKALRIQARLDPLRAGHAADLGDPFPGPAEVNDLTPDGAVRLFGDSELSSTLFRVPLGRWYGPYRSGYGWHLVYVATRLPESLPPLAQIRDRVVADYLEEKRVAAGASRFAALRVKYTVHIGDDD